MVRPDTEILLCKAGAVGPAIGKLFSYMRTGSRLQVTQKVLNRRLKRFLRELLRGRDSVALRFGAPAGANGWGGLGPSSQLSPRAEQPALA